MQPAPGKKTGSAAFTGRLALCNHGRIGIIEGYDGRGLWKGVQLFSDKPWQSRAPKIIHRDDEQHLIAAAERMENE